MKYIENEIRCETIYQPRHLQIKETDTQRIIFKTWHASITLSTCYDRSKERKNQMQKSEAQHRNEMKRV